MNDLQRERLLELLADQAIFGLKDEELIELEQLKTQFPEWEKDFTLELAATAITLSNLEVNDELPISLRTRLLVDADKFFSQSRETQKAIDFTPQLATGIDSSATENFGNYIVAETPQRPFWQWLGWAFAAAACVALAVNLWTTRIQNSVEVAKKPETIQTPTPELTPAQKRAQLLASATDAVQLPLTDPKNDKEILGDVVWSNSLQTGYVRISGLPANNVSEEAYQLWIVDEARNPKTPLSGGVFTISAAGEVVVPIEAQLAVKKPLAIAISKEKPGGVVVSAPERLVALAKI